MDARVGDIVISGDVLQNIPKEKEGPVILGPGLRIHAERIVACKSGILKKKSSNTYWIDTYQKRYVPVRGETVIGVLTSKSGDFLKVDIGTSEQASISYLSFEGATKKNRPDFNVGDLIFARLVTASRYMEPQLVCVDSYGKAGRLGILPSDGFLFPCSLNLVRKILRPNCPTLKILGKEIPHEITIGLNGRIWVKAKTVKQTIAICNAILASEHLTNEEIIPMCNNTLETLFRMS